MAYEAPSLTQVGTVEGLTQGLDTWREWNDEYHFYGVILPAPGTGHS